MAPRTQSPFPRSPCPEGGPGGAAGAPTRPGPAQSSFVGLAAASSDQALLTGLRASPSPAPREDKGHHPPQPIPLCPRTPLPTPPLGSASCEKHLFHSGLREATLSRVEIARSKRSRSKAEPRPTTPGCDPSGSFLPELWMSLSFCPGGTSGPCLAACRQDWCRSTGAATGLRAVEEGGHPRARERRLAEEGDTETLPRDRVAAAPVRAWQG